MKYKCKVKYKCSQTKMIKKKFKKTNSNSYRVICAKCGKKSTVPFKPTQNKPIYCKTCFMKRKNN